MVLGLLAACAHASPARGWTGRGTLSLRDAALRARYVASMGSSWPLDALAAALDVVCERAEQAEAAAREALVAIVDALNSEGMQTLVQRLREQAAGESLLALERLIRQPMHALSGAAADARAAGNAMANRPRPAQGSRGDGRPLTLGERKWLARRPDRDTIQRLLADPHPDVIFRCLRSPRMTEDDIVRLAAKRPGRGEVLAEIARSRWAHRPRVRVALVMNPATCCSGPSSSSSHTRRRCSMDCALCASNTSSAARRRTSPRGERECNSRRGRGRAVALALFLFDFPASERGHSDGRCAGRAQGHVFEMHFAAPEPQVHASPREVIAVLVAGPERSPAGIATTLFRVGQGRAVRSDTPFDLL